MTTPDELVRKLNTGLAGLFRAGAIVAFADETATAAGDSPPRPHPLTGA